MGSLSAGVLGGLSAGAVASAVQVFGRDTGLVHRTLAENARDRLTELVPPSSPLRPLAENDQVVHFGVAAVLGAAYGVLRPAFRWLPPSVAGALFGAGLYAVNVAQIAPKAGVTAGEDAAPPEVTRERLMVNIAFGVITAFVVASLVEGREHHRAEDED